MRLFLGIAVDDQVRASVAGVRARVEAALGASAAAFKWTRAENVHVTLHFLGEVPAERSDELRRVFGEPLPEPAFLASTGPLGAFPERGAPRVVFLAVDRGADAMARVHVLLGERVRQLALPVEARPFTPHFTLARARDRRSAPGLRQQLASVAVPAATWHVDHATLFRSDLSGASPRYEVLVHMPLAGPRRTS